MISTILPTFRLRRRRSASALGMWLLNGSSDGLAPGAQARSQRLESTRARKAPVALREVPAELVPPLRGRQPGGVVEASGVLGDRGCKHDVRLPSAQRAGALRSCRLAATRLPGAAERRRRRTRRQDARAAGRSRVACSARRRERDRARSGGPERRRRRSAQADRERDDRAATAAVETPSAGRRQRAPRGSVTARDSAPAACRGALPSASGRRPRSAGSPRTRAMCAPSRTCSNVDSSSSIRSDTQARDLSQAAGLIPLVTGVIASS